MAAAKDIKLDENGDLFIDPITGDFAIDFSDNQHIQDLINAFAGWWKEFPDRGFGIKQFQGSSGKEQEMERGIKLQLQSDKRPDADGNPYNTNGIRCTQNPDGSFIIDAKNITR